MKKKLVSSLLFLMSLLVCVSFISFISFDFVNAFTVTTNLTSNTVCPGSTIVIEDIVSGTGSFTVSVGGTASNFATTVPLGFWLEDTQVIYSYITPSSKITPGVYSLEITIESAGITKTVKHSIVVENCHLTVLKAEPETQTICSCEEKTIDLNIENKGKYLENYKIEVQGIAKLWISLSSETFSLAPNSSISVEAYVMTPCNIAGNYEVNFAVESASDYAKANTKASFEVVSCYDYELTSEQSFYSICEAEQLNIPVKIKNIGTRDNVYKINVYGPDWVNVDQSQVSASETQEISFNLMAKPAYKTEGDFNVAIEILSEKGKVLKKIDLKINVETCYGVLVTIEQEKDKMCNALSNTYSVIVKNTGKFTNTYDVSLEAPEWAAIDEKHFSLEAGEEKPLTLDVHPPFGFKAGTYDIIVNALDHVSGADASSKIIIETITTEYCYKPAINTEKTTIDVARDSAATVPFIVENKGINKADYNIEISGTGVSFSQINPGSISLESTKAQTLYLYIAPPIETALDAYTITVTTRLKDTTIVSSKTITINVVEAGEAEELELELEPEEPEESLFSRFISWLANLFKREKAEENITTEEEAEAEEGENNPPVLAQEIPDVSVQAGEEYSINLNDYFNDPDNDSLTYITVRPLNISVKIIGSIVKITPQADFTGVREMIFYTSDGVDTTSSNKIKITVTTAEEVTAEEEEEPEEEEEETTEEEPTEEETEEEITNETSNATSNNLTETTENSEENTLEDTTTTTPNTTSKLSEYKGWFVLGAIILILIIILLSGAGKKIISFFEEEENNKRKK